MNKSIQHFYDIDKSINDLEPSFEKSSFITLQFSEHIFNSISHFDKRVNKHNRDTLSNYIKRLGIILNQIDKNDKFSRYLPKDNFQVILEFCINHIYKILKQPKTSIIKEPKMLHLSKITSMTQRTAKWLGRKPGETVRAKLSNSRKILADKKRFTYDIKENQTTLYLLRKLNKIVKNRIDYGVKNDLYDLDYSSDIKKTLDKLLKLNSLSKQYPISESKIKKTTIANNTLLSHKHYSIIWKTFRYLNKYYSDDNFDKRLGHSKNKFISLFAVSLASYFYHLSDKAFIFDDILNIEDKINNIFVIKKDVDNEINYKKPISFAILLEGKKFQQDRKLLKIEVKNNLNGLVQVIFNEMKLNDKQFLTNTETSSFDFHFSFKEHENYQKNRGLPFGIYIDNNKDKQTEFFADALGFKDSIHFVLKEIKQKFNIINNFLNDKLNDTEYKENNIDRLIFDFESYMPYLYIGENKKLFESNIISNINLDNINYLYNIKSIYSNNNVMSLKDIYKDENTVNKNYFLNSIKNIRKSLEYNIPNTIIHLTSDNSMEIRQKYIRTVLKGEFNNIFPIWRSVAAASYLESSKKESFKNGNNILVIDLLDELAEPVRLEYFIDDKKNKLWKHYPPYAGIEDNKISFDNICREYLTQFNNKYNIAENAEDLNFLLDSGIVSEILTSNSIKNIYFVYKDKIYSIYKFNNLLKTIFNNFENDVKNYNINNNYKYIVIIGNNLYNDDLIRNSFNSIKKNAEIKFINTDKLSIGAYEIYKKYCNTGYSWIEYLPALSLEVVKDRRYHQLELIDENKYTNVGEDFTVEVEESLTLPSNVNEIKLKLIKENDVGNRVFAFIRDKSFPLDKEIDVKLQINYKYAAENSYELIAYPVDKNSGFEKILIEWDYSNTVKLEDKPIPFNQKNKNIDKDKFDKFREHIKLLKDYERYFNNKEYHNFKLFVFFRRVLIDIFIDLKNFIYLEKNDRNQYFSENDVEDEIDYLFNFLKNVLDDKNIFYDDICINKLLEINIKDKSSKITKIDILIYKKIIKFLFNKIAGVMAWKFREKKDSDIVKKIYKYCLETWKENYEEDFMKKISNASNFLDKVLNNTDKSSKNYKRNRNNNSKEFLYNKFGILDILKFLIYEERNINNIKIFQDMYELSINYDKITLLGNISYLLYKDDYLLQFIYDNNKNFIISIENILLKTLIEVSKEKKENNNNNTRLNRIVDYGLLILSMLRLRPKGYFRDLATGSSKAIILSEYIRKIDNQIYEGYYTDKRNNNMESDYIASFDNISLLKFDMSKEPKVKMCTLLYVIDILLTGDDGENSITIEALDD
ncbi:hypothetical protein R4J17_09170 [Brachyspira intermedia]|uniref:hypothetical protein n=2 Tax=Brachyspira intermedia TaxID=84377 RepID=UPI003005BB90